MREIKLEQEIYGKYLTNYLSWLKPTDLSGIQDIPSCLQNPCFSNLWPRPPINVSDVQACTEYQNVCRRDISLEKSQTGDYYAEQNDKSAF
jgi:hypothetical protein